MDLAFDDMDLETIITALAQFEPQVDEYEDYRYVRLLRERVQAFLESHRNQLTDSSAAVIITV